MKYVNLAYFGQFGSPDISYHKPNLVYGPQAPFKGYPILKAGKPCYYYFSTMIILLLVTIAIIVIISIITVLAVFVVIILPGRAIRP